MKPVENQLAMEAPWADVPEDMRPRNVSGQCAWDAGESMFGGAGYPGFKGWGRNASRQGWVGGWVTGVVHAAKDHGIEMKVVTNKDYSIFEHAEKEGVPVYVQIAVYRPNDHAVCLTGLDADYAYILDNNGPAVVKRWSRRTFDRVWNGIACCPCRRNPKPVEPVPVPVKPAKPTPVEPPPAKPTEQPKPACPCPAAPAVDLKPILDRIAALEAAAKVPAAKVDLAEVNTGISQLTQISNKLTQITVNQSKSIDDLAKSVGTLNDRVTKLESAAPAPRIASRIVQVKSP